jgi:4-oxalocrotonate tautomerase
MPHIIVKLFPGRTEVQKKQLTSEIVKAIRTSIDAPDNSISVSIEEVPKEKWAEEVYKPDIIDKEHLLYKKPDYKPSR